MCVTHVQDDFMLQAAAEGEEEDEEDEDGAGGTFGGKGFDLDAHIAKLLKAADEHDVGSLRTAKVSKGLKKKKDTAHSHPRFYNIDESDEEKEDDVRDEDDFDEDEYEEGDEDEDDDEDDDDEEHDGGHESTMKRNAKAYIGTAFHRVMMSEYADENIGELDGEDPRVKGTGLHEKALESAMDEFLNMDLEDDDDANFLDAPRIRRQREKEKEQQKKPGVAGAGAEQEGDDDEDDEEDDEEGDDEGDEDEDEDEGDEEGDAEGDDEDANEKDDQVFVRAASCSCCCCCCCCCCCRRCRCRCFHHQCFSCG